MMTQEPTKQKKSDWLFGKPQDLSWLYAPVWVSWLVCFLLPASVMEQSLPLWGWVVIVLAIDVAHVWSTLWRTYFDKEEFRLHQNLLIVAPFLSFTIMFLLAFFLEGWFWRIMAYLALYHFVRQQYGFMMLYRVRFQQFTDAKWLKDKFIIYFSMVYPVVFWHFQSDRNFHWFAELDFLPIHQWFPALPHGFWATLNLLYWGVMATWLLESFIKENPLSKGKLLWIITTAFNWYLGIVYFNSDVAFTLTNVVAHGIPYLALIVIYKGRKEEITTSEKRKTNWIALSLTVAGSALVFGFLEEFFWDFWVNQDKKAFFGWFISTSSEAIHNPYFKAAAIGLLSVPQVTHYLVDGFIWKKSPKNPYVPKVLLSK